MSRTELSIYMVNILAIVILVLWIITVVRICRLWKTDKAAAKDMLGKLVFKTVMDYMYSGYHSAPFAVCCICLKYRTQYACP